MNKKMALGFFVFYACQIMIAMDLPEKNEQVLGLVVNYLFQHKAVCSVAMVSKFQNKRISETVASRKVNLYVSPEGEKQGSVVHQWGSARCYAYSKPYLNADRMNLMMCYCESDGVAQSYRFFDFMFRFPHCSVPFLNRENQWCFDGCGAQKISMGVLGDCHVPYDVVRYNLSGVALPLILKITNACGNGFFHSKVINFRNYPSLLQSILAVKKVEKKYYVPPQFQDFLEVDRALIRKYFLEINLEDVFFEEDWDQGENFLDVPDFLVLEKYPSLKKILEKQYKKQCELYDFFMV